MESNIEEKLKGKKEEEKRIIELKEKEKKEKIEMQIADVKTKIDDLDTYEGFVLLVIPIIIIFFGFLIIGSFYAHFNYIYFSDKAAKNTLYMGFLTLFAILFAYICFFAPRFQKKVKVKKEELNSKLKELEK